MDAIAMDVIVAGYQIQQRMLISSSWTIHFQLRSMALVLRRTIRSYDKVQKTLEEMAADGTF